MVQTKPRAQVIGIGQLPKITELLKDEKFLGFDTEATGKNPRHDKIIAMQFGTQDQAYILDCRPLHEMLPAEKMFWSQAVDNLLHSGPTFVGHNLKYDWQMIFQSFGAQLDFPSDTMLREQIIHGVGWGNSRVGLSLLATANRYEIPVTKEEVIWFVDLDQRGEWFDPFPQEQIDYMEQDVFVPLQIREMQEWKLEQEGMLDVAVIEDEALPAFAFMEYCGCQVDIPRWREIVDILSAEHEQLQSELQAELSGYIQASRRKRYDEAKKAYDAWKELRDIFDAQSELEYPDKRARGELTTHTDIPLSLEEYAKNALAAWDREHDKPNRRKKEEYTQWTLARTAFEQTIPEIYLERQASDTVPRYSETLTLAQYKKLAREEAFLGEHPEPRHATPAEERRINEPINLGAWQQLLEAFRAIGIHVPNTQAETLEAYIDRPVIAKLLRWKDLNKFKTTYGYSMLAKVDMLDGRMHASFAQIGAETGRTSSYDPNFQNIPKEKKGQEHLSLRRCFIAPRGSKLLVCDYPSIEVRILAELSGDMALLKAFASDIDIHSAIAKMMFNLSEDVDPKKAEVVSGVSYRTVAKTIIFGLSYGMGARGLAARIGTSVELAEQALNTFKQTFETAMSYLTECAFSALREGYSRTPSGRMRKYHNIPKKPPYYGTTPEEWEEHRKTEAYQKFKSARAQIMRWAKNHPIQGCNADMIKIAMRKLYWELPTGCKIVGTVHDEVVIEARDELVEEAKTILNDCMLSAARVFLKKVAFPLDETKTYETLDVSVEQYWSKG